MADAEDEAVASISWSKRSISMLLDVVGPGVATMEFPELRDVLCERLDESGAQRGGDHHPDGAVLLPPRAHHRSGNLNTNWIIRLITVELHSIIIPRY